MNKRLKIFTIIALLAIFCQNLSAQPVVKTLDDGLTLIFEEDHSTQLITIDVWVKGGSAYETNEANGVSHLIEHLVFYSTKTRDISQFDFDIESMGATLEARTSKDWAHFFTTVTTSYFSKALNIISEALCDPVFDKNAIYMEKSIISDEIKKIQNEPVLLCKELLSSRIYGNHPYAMPVTGVVEKIEALEQQDIFDHYKKHYTPENIAIVIVGDTTLDTAQAEVAKYFKFKNVGKQVELANVEKKQIGEEHITMPFKQTYLAIGFLGPKGSDYKDVCATDVIATHLSRPHVGWMEKNLAASGVTTDFLTERSNGLIAVIAAGTNENAAANRDTIFSHLEQIKQNGIPANEIESAKRYLLGTYAFQNETFGGRANTYGFYYTVSKPEFAFDYISNIQGVTNKDIITAANKYFNKNDACILTIGGEAK